MTKRVRITVRSSCPSCGGYTVVKSRRRPLEYLLCLIGLRPARCGECSTRFYRPMIHPALRRR